MQITTDGQEWGKTISTPLIKTVAATGASQQGDVDHHRLARPLRESIVGEYKRHLNAAIQAGETCSCCDVKYLTDLLDVMLRDCKWPRDGDQV